jgi:hypothetical protein
MTAIAYIHHQVPGRLRIRVPAQRGDVEYFATVVRHLATVPGVERLEANHRTASVLVVHDHGAAAQQILHDAQQRGLFTVHGAPGKTLTAAEKAGLGLQGLDTGLRNITRGDLDVRSLVLGAFVTMGVVQLTRGHVMGPAVTLFWYAYQIIAGSRGGKT